VLSAVIVNSQRAPPPTPRTAPALDKRIVSGDVTLLAQQTHFNAHCARTRARPADGHQGSGRGRAVTRLRKVIFRVVPSYTEAGKKPPARRKRQSARSTLERTSNGRAPDLSVLTVRRREHESFDRLAHRRRFATQSVRIQFFETDISRVRDTKGIMWSIFLHLPKLYNSSFIKCLLYYTITKSHRLYNKIFPHFSAS